MTSPCSISLISAIQDFLEVFFKFFFSNINEVLSDEQEKESIILVRMGKKNLSLSITNCHHWASLVMPISDPWDVFFHPILIDSYNAMQGYITKKLICLCKLVCTFVNCMKQIRFSYSD